MSLERIPWYVWLIPAMMLVAATAKLPYGYYTLLRLVTCGTAGLIAFASWGPSSASQKWAVAFALVAILFNPIIPVHLTRGAWFFIDIACAALFVVHLLLVRRRIQGDVAK